MTHKDVYEHFKVIMPEYANNLSEWFPSGKNAIRIRFKLGREFIFTCNDPKNWRFETIDSFIKSMKGGSKM